MYAVGIDMGGTTIKIGIVTSKGDILSKSAFFTKIWPDKANFIPGLKDEILAACKISALSPTESILGIGIGAPNGNYFSGAIEYAPNLPWKGIFDIKQELENAFTESTGKVIPVQVTNDANCAALGEKLFGAAKEFSDFIVVTLGTGIGGGIFCGGKLLYGKYGNAGEIGHVSVVDGGRPCGCGRKGCIEKYASAGGLVETALELGVSSQPTTAKDVYAAAINGDKKALEAFDITAKYLGRFLSDLVNIFSPQAIIITGGVVQSKHFLFEPLEKYFRNDFSEMHRGREIKLISSALSEQDAAILGAASLVF